MKKLRKIVKESLQQFKEKSDPIEDMGIGYDKRILNSKTLKILNFIKDKGPKGASFTEIQHYIWVDLSGKDPDEFWEKDHHNLRKSRGFWVTSLYGGSDYNGILRVFCKQNPKTHRWIFVRYPKPRRERFYMKR